MNNKKLYKNEKNKLLCGVCAGIADYFSIDATIVRICFVAFSIVYGSGALLYLIAALIMESEP